MNYLLTFGATKKDLSTYIKHFLPPQCATLLRDDGYLGELDALWEKDFSKKDRLPSAIIKPNWGQEYFGQRKSFTCLDQKDNIPEVQVIALPEMLTVKYQFRAHDDKEIKQTFSVNIDTIEQAVKWFRALDPEALFKNTLNDHPDDMDKFFRNRHLKPTNLAYALESCDEKYTIATSGVLGPYVWDENEMRQ